MVIGIIERAVLLPWAQTPHLSLFLTATDEDGAEEREGCGPGGPPADQGDLSEDSHRIRISHLHFSTVCPTHTHGPLMDFRLCASPVLD